MSYTGFVNCQIKLPQNIIRSFTGFKQAKPLDEPIIVGAIIVTLTLHFSHCWSHKETKGFFQTFIIRCSSLYIIPEGTATWWFRLQLYDYRSSIIRYLRHLNTDIADKRKSKHLSVSDVEWAEGILNGMHRYCRFHTAPLRNFRCSGWIMERQK